MALSEAEIVSMEQYFASIEIPATLKINLATTYMDLPKFIANAFKTVRSDEVSELARRVRWDDLVQIRGVLESKG